MSDQPQPVTQAAAPVRLVFQARAGADLSKFLRGLTGRRIVGRRCDSCTKVYVPPRGACPTCGTRMGDEVEVSQHGTVTTFCVINIPFEGQKLKPPYVCASVLLDGADIGLFHLIGGCNVGDVRMGMRVKAVWVDDADMELSLESIKYFEPSGEADVPFDAIREYI